MGHHSPAESSTYFSPSRVSHIPLHHPIIPGAINDFIERMVQTVKCHLTYQSFIHFIYSKHQSYQEELKPIWITALQRQSFQKQVQQEAYWIENSLLQMHLTQSYQEKHIRPAITSQSLVSDTGTQRSQSSRQAEKTRFDDNPVSSVNNIPVRQHHDGTIPSSRNRRRKLILDVTEPRFAHPSY